MTSHNHDSGPPERPEFGVAAMGAIPIHPAALLNEEQAAALLGLSVKTLQAWRVRGQGPDFVRISGRIVRYEVQAVQRFIASQRVSATGPDQPKETDDDK